MTSIPALSPPSLPGVAWRPAATGDAPGLADLAAAINEAEGLEFVGGPDFWGWWLGQHRLGDDTLLAIDRGGRVLAATGSWVQVTPSGARAILWLDAHPEHLDLDPFLLRWAEQRACRQLEGAGGSRVIRISAEEHRSRRRRVIEEAGFRNARTFVEMERPLTGDIPDLPVPEGPTTTTWEPSLDEAARIASNAAFADHWGSLPMDPDTWASMVLDEDTMRRGLSFLAVVADEVVAMSLASVDVEEDPECLWIDRVAVVPSWRRRGLASALVARSLRAGADAGLGKARLGVDEENGWDAPALYRRLGFEVTKRSVTYLKELS